MYNWCSHILQAETVHYPANYSQLQQDIAFTFINEEKAAIPETRCWCSGKIKRARRSNAARGFPNAVAVRAHPLSNAKRRSQP